MLETWVQSLGQGDLLEEGMATRSSILAWEIPWTEEPGGLQSLGSQRVGQNLVTKTHTEVIHFTSVHIPLAKVNHLAIPEIVRCVVLQQRASLTWGQLYSP